MSGGKISPEIAAAAEEVMHATRTEIMAAMDGMMRAVANEILPLQQDVAKLNERVRQLEQGRDITPAVSDGKTSKKTSY